MPIKTRSLGFTNSLQRLVWSQGNNVPVTAYLWGGGGGGGGNDRGAGGNGSGGGFTELTFTVDEGDVIDVAVGGPGGRGPTGAGGTGGTAGASYTGDIIFDTRSTVASPPVIASTNSAYVSFLNQYGVWVNPVTARNFDRSYVVNFPITGTYTFVASADNSASLYVDDIFVGDVPGFKATYTLTTSVLAGNHTVRIVAVNTGGPGSVALTIDGGGSYSGGAGGCPGAAGSSGGGGGGGGATVIFKNGVPLAVAAGGGGGGGAGRNSGGDDAPGSGGQAGPDDTAGQNGQNRTTDGGGGGGGGGGLRGGNGGLIRSGDSGAQAGANGLSSSPAQNPSGRTPGGTNNAYYPGQAGTGGRSASGGSAGAAVILFDIPGVFVNDGTSFKPVGSTWVKTNDVWQEASAIYVKADGVWEPVAGSLTPVFTGTSGNFGVAARSIAPEPLPPDPGPSPSRSSSGWNFSPSPTITSWQSSVNTFGSWGNDSSA
jgi:hypothetical protein